MIDVNAGAATNRARDGAGATLIAIEGADGAGKATAAAGLVAGLRDQGRKAEVISFPRYGDTMAGKALGDFLAGRTPPPDHPSALAALYALDRFESRATIARATAENDVVVFDRYVASNVAYQAAKVPAAERGGLVQWIIDLETATFGLPRPDLNVYLDTPPEVARRLMTLKGSRSYTDEALDAHEADERLQMNVRDAYSRLVGANGGALGRWKRLPTVRAGELLPAAAIVAELLQDAIGLLEVREAGHYRRSPKSQTD